MKIAVIGAGVIGITTAYELASSGHQVTVLERRGAAAEEASFANGGVVAPGLPARFPGWLLDHPWTLRLGLPLSASEMNWLWKSYRSGRLESHLARRARLRCLAIYSRERLHQITSDLKLEYERSDGHLVLLRTEKDSKRLQPELKLLREAGVAFQELDPSQARKMETALNPDMPLFAAIHVPDDELGNCRQFALLLKNEAQHLGVKFEFNTQVCNLRSADGVALGVVGEDAERRFDSVVLCAGLDSSCLLAPLGLKMALTGVHGYSVSAAIREPLNAPRSAVTDDHFQVSISRLGRRVRVCGGKELGGSRVKKNPATLARLYQVLNDWFPGAVNLSSGVQEWKGTQATLSDGLPLVGASGITGVWLNLGHGANGWALSCGAARVLADRLSGRIPEIDFSGLSLAQRST